MPVRPPLPSYALRIAREWLPESARAERTALLARDIDDVAEELGVAHNPTGLDLAAHTLACRIGGIENVDRYVDCLVAGDRLRRRQRRYFVCVYCGTSHLARNAPGGEDIACCGEVGHVEPDPDVDVTPENSANIPAHG